MPERTMTEIQRSRQVCTCGHIGLAHMDEGLPDRAYAGACLAKVSSAKHSGGESCPCIGFTEQEEQDG